MVHIAIAHRFPGNTSQGQRTHALENLHRCFKRSKQTARINSMQAHDAKEIDIYTNNRDDTISASYERHLVAPRGEDRSRPQQLTWFDSCVQARGASPKSKSRVDPKLRPGRHWTVARHRNTHCARRRFASRPQAYPTARRPLFCDATGKCDRSPFSINWLCIFDHKST